ncbi:MAG: hypothetical protein SGI96_22100 [Bacteroidota bacterium]|nr:hypothetical protein [Bacteroidota bacterium]
MKSFVFILHISPFKKPLGYHIKNLCQPSISFVQKLIIIFFSTSHFLTPCISQDNKKVKLLTDSLYLDLSDSLKSDISIRLSVEYYSTNIREAKKNAQQAYHLAEKSNDLSLLVSASRNMAATERKLENINSLLLYDSLYLTYARKTNDPENIFLALKLNGDDYLSIYKLPRAKKYFDEALMLITAKQNIKRFYSIYKSLGDYYFKSFQLEKAKTYYKKAMDEASLVDDEYGLNHYRKNYANIFVFQNKVDSSVNYLFDAIAYFKKEKRFDAVGECYQSLGMGYKSKGNISKAIESYSQARKYFFDDNNKKGIINQDYNLADLYLRLNQYNTADIYIAEAEKLSKSFNYPAGQLTSLLSKAKLSYYKGDTAQARHFFKEAGKIVQTENSTALTTLYNTEKAIYLFRTTKPGLGDSAINAALKELKNLVPGEFLEVKTNEVKKLISSLQDTDSTLYIQKVEQLIKSNPFLNDTAVNSLSVLYNKQLLEIETQYKTKQKNDSLLAQAQLLGTQAQLLKLKETQKKKLWIGIGVLSGLALFIGFLLFKLNNQKKKVVREKKAVENLTGILKHETSRQFGELKTNIVKILKAENPRQQVSKALTRVKTYEMLYNNLFISDGLAAISLKNAFEKIFEYHCDENDPVKKSTFIISGGEDIVFNKSDYLFQYMNELMANSFEHAFNGIKNPQINVSIVYHKPVYEITYRDNGTGLPQEKQQIIQGKGLYYIQAYATQNLHGTLEINAGLTEYNNSNEAGRAMNGTEYKLTFNENNL